MAPLLTSDGIGESGLMGPAMLADAGTIDIVRSITIIKAVNANFFNMKKSSSGNFVWVDEIISEELVFVCFHLHKIKKTAKANLPSAVWQSAIRRPMALRPHFTMSLLFRVSVIIIAILRLNYKLF
jgi:hypothetical protein